MRNYVTFILKGYFVLILQEKQSRGVTSSLNNFENIFWWLMHKRRTNVVAVEENQGRAKVPKLLPPMNKFGQSGFPWLPSLSSFLLTSAMKLLRDGFSILVEVTWYGSFRILWGFRRYTPQRNNGMFAILISPENTYHKHHLNSLVEIELKSNPFFTFTFQLNFSWDNWTWQGTARWLETIY